MKLSGQPAQGSATLLPLLYSLLCCSLCPSLLVLCKGHCTAPWPGLWGGQGGGGEAGYEARSLPAHQTVPCQMERHQEDLQSTPAMISWEANTTINSRLQEHCACLSWTWHCL